MQMIQSKLKRIMKNNKIKELKTWHNINQTFNTLYRFIRILFFLHIANTPILFTHIIHIIHT